MDRRRAPRVTATLPVRIWGLDACALPFMQLASVRNISSQGAVLQGLRRQILPGEVLDVQFGEGRAQFRVVWAGQHGTPLAGEAGIEMLPAQPCIWDVNLERCCQFVGNG